MFKKDGFRRLIVYIPRTQRKALARAIAYFVPSILIYSLLCEKYYDLQRLAIAAIAAIIPPFGVLLCYKGRVSSKTHFIAAICAITALSAGLLLTLAEVPHRLKPTKVSQGDYSSGYRPWLKQISPPLLLSSGEDAIASKRSLLRPKDYEFAYELSVVIAIRNEEEFIQRTVEYLLETTKDEELREIVLVDDASDEPVDTYVTQKWCAQILDGYKHAQDKIKIMRFNDRQGLIRAKIAGAELSTAPNIFFMDGHCRPEVDWARPLMNMVNPALEGEETLKNYERQHPLNLDDLKQRNKLTNSSQLDYVPSYRRIVVPQIFDIDRETWMDKGSFGLKMMFDWTFEFDWFEDLSPYVPILPGGIQLITRKWWEESGRYDSGMLEWGGENIEQSLRAWLCGGEILQTSQSRIGHIFDRPAKPNPGNSLVHRIQANQKRTAIVWLDDYYQYIHKLHPEMRPHDPGMGLEYRQMLREHLSCAPFQKFVDRFRPAFERFALLRHEYHNIVDVKTDLCLTALDTNHAPSLIWSLCQSNSPRQLWSQIFGGRMMQNLESAKCLSAISNGLVELAECRYLSMLKSKIADHTQYDSFALRQSS